MNSNFITTKVKVTWDVITGLTHLVCVCPESTPHMELFPFVRDVSQYPIFLVPESLPAQNALPPCKLTGSPSTHTTHNIKGVLTHRLQMHK